MSISILAANIRALMESSDGLNTQVALAKASGVDQTTVSRVLKAKNSPSLEVITAIADAFQLQPWQMLVPNIDPKNLPVCDLTRVEIELYKKLRGLVETLPPLSE